MRRVYGLVRWILLQILQSYLSGSGWRVDGVALYLSRLIDRLDAGHYCACKYCASARCGEPYFSCRNQ